MNRCQVTQSLKTAVPQQSRVWESVLWQFQETSSRSKQTDFVHPEEEVVLVTRGSVPSLGPPPRLAVEVALGACRRTLSSGADNQLLVPRDGSHPCTPQSAGRFPRSLVCEDCRKQGYTQACASVPLGWEGDRRGGGGRSQSGLALHQGEKGVVQAWGKEKDRAEGQALPERT